MDNFKNKAQSFANSVIERLIVGNKPQIDPARLQAGVQNLSQRFQTFAKNAPSFTRSIQSRIANEVLQPKLQGLRFISPSEVAKNKFQEAQKKAESFQAATSRFKSSIGDFSSLRPKIAEFTQDFQNRLQNVNERYIQPAVNYAQNVAEFAQGQGPRAERFKEIAQNNEFLRGLSPNASGQDLFNTVMSVNPIGAAGKALNPAQKAAMTKMKNLLTYTNDLVQRGMPKAQAEKMGFKQAQEWIKNFDSSGQKGLEFMEEMGREAKQQFVKWQQPKQVKTASFVNVDGLVDLSGFSAGFRDVFRNFQKVYGKKYAEVKQTLLDPFDAAKGQFVRENESWAKALSDNVVKKFSIHKGTKESAAIQQFGEGLRDYPSLVKEFGDSKAKQIVESDKFFRSAYDQLLDEVNRVRKAIYPSDPEKIIPRRRDYYRHFKEMAEGFQGLANIFDTPAGIDSTLAGISYRTEPKSRFLSFAQKRKGDWTSYDAVGGFIDYVKSANYSKFIDPQIGKFRDLADSLAAATTEGTKEPGKLNNFILFLNRFADDLSGKTNPLDRTIQEWIPGGRQSFKALAWLNSRVKANVILGNLKSSIAQIFNVPQGIANAGIGPSVKGFGRAIAGIFDKDNAIKQSTFIAERYSKAFDQFDRGLLANPKRFAVWITQVLDEAGTNYIWQSHYAKALAENIPNPVKYADDITRNMVGGRGVGEPPLAQKSKMFQIIAPFQLEVTNLWWVMKDFVDERAFQKLAKFAVASYVFNRAAEQIRGSGVSFDPLEAMIDAFKTFREEKEKGKGALKAGGRLAGEVLSNVPLGQSLAAVYPQYGFKVGDTQLPTRKEFFGKEDPTRFGTGLIGVVGGGLQDPLYKVLPPFGGQQIKRMVEGSQAIKEGGTYTASGNLRYPVSPGLGPVLMGPSAGDRAGTAALGPKQTEQYIRMINSGISPEQAYTIFEKKRELQKLIDEKKKELESKKPKTKPEIDVSIQDLLPQLVKKAGAADAAEQNLITQLYAEEQAESERNSNIRDIYSLGLEKTERDKMLSIYGIDSKEAEIYIIKSLNVTNRSKVLKDSLKGMDNETFKQTAATMAQNELLTTGVTEVWEKNGDISSGQKRLLDQLIKQAKNPAAYAAPKARKLKFLPIRKISPTIKKIIPVKISVPKLRTQDFKPLTYKKITPRSWGSL
ncbi:hypothetical protein HYW42_05680 [Candidatus Daviesbacteria bacterium]|nr:hypothetical protein [Candidatus Daviesbacteria bacterium]